MKIAYVVIAVALVATLLAGIVNVYHRGELAGLIRCRGIMSAPVEPPTGWGKP